MDKSETDIFLRSLKLILIGIFFWIIKIKYFTIFLFPKGFILNELGVELIGTIIILLGLLIINRVYPFVYSSFALFLCCFIGCINLLEIFNYFFIKSYHLYILNKYIPFFMSILLFFIAKLLKIGIKYFGNIELSKKWETIGVVILFGFSIPYYAFVSLEIKGFLMFEKAVFDKTFFLLFLPLFFVIITLFFYFITTLVKTFKFLDSIKSEYEKI